MSSLIEWLESRRLFSATVVQVVSVEQAAMALVKEASQARIDAAASAKTGAADDKALRADLKRLKSVKGNAALLKEFSTREQGAEGEFKKDVTALSNSITKQTKQDVSAGINQC